MLQVLVHCVGAVHFHRVCGNVEGCLFYVCIRFGEMGVPDFLICVVCFFVFQERRDENIEGRYGDYEEWWVSGCLKIGQVVNLWDVSVKKCAIYVTGVQLE